MVAINPPSWLQNRTDHTAQTDRLTLAGLVETSGIGKVGDLLVSASTPAAMSVKVAAGRAFIVGTQNTHQGVYHVYNDADVTLTVTAASATLARKDIVIARVYDAFYSGTQNEWTLEVIAGVPAASPVEPALPANSVKLAVIDVGINVTTIVTANITNTATIAGRKAWLAGDPLPDPVGTAHTGVIDITATSFTNIIGALSIGLTLSKPAWCLVTLSAWMQAVNGELRAATTGSGATTWTAGAVPTGSPPQSWGGTTLRAAKIYLQQAVTIPMKINAGTTTFRVAAYRASYTSGTTTQLNYCSLSVTPQRYV